MFLIRLCWKTFSIYFAFNLSSQVIMRNIAYHWSFAQWRCAWPKMDSRTRHCLLQQIFGLNEIHEVDKKKPFSHHKWYNNRCIDILNKNLEVGRYISIYYFFFSYSLIFYERWMCLRTRFGFMNHTFYQFRGHKNWWIKQPNQMIFVLWCERGNAIY